VVVLDDFVEASLAVEFGDAGVGVEFAFAEEEAGPFVEGSPAEGGVEASVAVEGGHEVGGGDVEEAVGGDLVAEGFAGEVAEVVVEVEADDLVVGVGVEMVEEVVEEGLFVVLDEDGGGAGLGVFGADADDAAGPGVDASGFDVEDAAFRWWCGGGFHRGRLRLFWLDNY